MRLHLVALPHVRLGTPTTHLCAYSGKVMKFVKMMKDRHEIFLYAPESDPVEGATLVQCLSENARIAIFGKDDPNRLPEWPTDQQSRLFNLAASAKIFERAEKREELILLSGGLTHAKIAEELAEFQVCEPFVGYQGVLGGKSNAAYESYFHMAQTAEFRQFRDIRWYDRVIPPFVDPDEFPVLNEGKGEYLLFLGRLISRKGLNIASQIAEAVNMRLVVAGAGGQIEASDNQWVVHGQDTTAKLQRSADYVGPIGIEERAKLLAGARALICPTTYAEPGGNVAIEAMMAGTPVIAPDWGVFAETVVHGVTGFHFRTLQQAVEGVRQASGLDSSDIRLRTEHRYSLKAIAPKYDRWFEDLQTLWGEGWATLAKPLGAGPTGPSPLLSPFA